MKRILFILAAMACVYVGGAGATEPFTEQENFGDNAWMPGSWGDYDNDGDLDLAVGCDGAYDKLYVNNGDGTFTGEDQFGPGQGSFRLSLTWGDYDNDGDLDMLQGNSAGGRLYTNNGDGSFDEGLPLDMCPRRTTSVAWADCDNDGDLDCVLGSYDFYDPNPHILCINNGDGTFTEQMLGWGRTFAMAWGDYDGDGDPDLAMGHYVLFNGESDTCVYINNGDGTFTEYDIVPEDNFSYTFALAWGDYDNDGDLDLAGGNENSNVLWVNNGDGTLTPHTEFGCYNTQSVQWVDYDNDGDLDLAVGNYYSSWYCHNCLYINNGDGSFTEQQEFGVEKPTYSVAWGDYDKDGDQDLACINYQEQNYLYVNNEDDEDYLSIRLVGHFHDQGAGFSNRDGVGAKVSVYSEGHVGEADYFLGFREIEENLGRGQNSIEAEFGLPNDMYVDVLVIWPGSDGDHIEEYWSSVAKTQFITLDEGTGLSFSTGVVAIDPLGLGLSSVFPNPAKGDPTITFALPRSCAISLQVFDVQGRLIKTVAEGEHQQGNHSMIVDDLSNGVYMYRLEAGGVSETRKMVILR